MTINPDKVSLGEYLNWSSRIAVRGIVVDENEKIGMLFSQTRGYFSLPGGGVDKGEELEKAFEREVKEELGCEIQNIVYLGEIDEVRNEKKVFQKSFCFIAEVRGEKGEPLHTDEELLKKYKVVWIDKDKIVNEIETSPGAQRQGEYVSKIRNLRIINEFLENN